MDCTMPGPSLSPRIFSHACPLSQWCYLTIFSAANFSFCLQCFPTSGSYQWICSSHQMTKVLEFQLQLQHRSFQWISRVDFLEDWLVWSPCSPEISQESPPTPQFQSINCLALSLLYGPTLTFICDLPWSLIKSRWLQMSESKPLISTLLSWISSPAKPPFNKVTRNSPRLFLRSSLQFPESLWNYSNQPTTSSHSRGHLPKLVYSIPKCSPDVDMCSLQSFPPQAMSVMN